MNSLEKLKYLKSLTKEVLTEGLQEKVISYFLQKDSRLEQAIAMAYDTYQEHRIEFGELFHCSENKQIEEIQKDYVNFYSKETVNPYVALGASGPWIVTSCGAVIHDNGGYGMLGFGHNPESIAKAMSKPFAMANIMTANIWQRKLTDSLNSEIGHTRTRQSDLFEKYLCLNSGSESVTAALRISDARAKKIAAGRKIKILALSQGFHGRTDRPAQASDSCLEKYKNLLSTFSSRENLVTIPVNDCEALKKPFKDAASNNDYFEIFMMEPVMGEGNPGQSVHPEFYQLARELTLEHDSLLLVDSIQAGLRANGCLSIVDYPGFQEQKAPDFETYSKALNAGQYPFSVLAMNSRSAGEYQNGLYGNTMTTNPRAIAVAVEVFRNLDKNIRTNIVGMGKLFLEKFEALKEEFPQIILGVQGTGLLFSMEINPQKAQVVGYNGLETLLRKRGIGVIHGGTNALRFTPVFDITKEEVSLIVDELRDVFNSLN